MTNFKLIAITPLEGCSDKFSKNLTLGLPYQFYDQYEITVDSKKEKIEKVKKKENYDFTKGLYTLKNGIEVDFSAVAGKNGSGKSTLFELFYYLIYYIGTNSINGEEPILNKAFMDLENRRYNLLKKRNDLIAAAQIHKEDFIAEIKADPISNLDFYILELIQEYDMEIDTSRADSMRGIYKIVSGNLKSLISDLSREIDREKEQDVQLEKEFNISMLYELDGNIREIECNNRKISHFIFKDDAKLEWHAFTLDSFFYTISLNYSHHSLNSNALGLWISKLFHKNDAYRTPVIINPMRTVGNFDINDELKLSRERLISTLAYDLATYKTDTLLLGKYAVSSYIFTTKRGLGNYDLDEIALNLIKEKLGLDEVPSDIPYAGLAMSYLNKKIKKVKETYNYLIGKGDDGKPSLEQFLLTDTSHLTRKINQTLNYLKACSDDIQKKIWGKTEEGHHIELTPEELKKYLDFFFGDLLRGGPEDIIKFALPGFFNIDFEFTDLNGGKIKLSDLSSGEQQAIFNLNSILYHLYNIQSVHGKNVEPAPSKDGSLENPENSLKHIKGIDRPNRPAYSHVNIVLDEVELYYHPEMQRMLVQNLIASFENLQDSSGIKAINVCILTHSPFILSDIPLSNVLLLDRNEKGKTIVKESENETFAANINDLLADNFFLDETLIGAFAERKIENLIKKIEAGYYNPKADGALVQLIGDPYLKSSIINFIEKS